MPSRLLIIDDDEDVRERLQLALAAEGYEALCAPDAEAALAAIDRTPFDVVLCDLGMAGTDGMELLPHLARRLPDASLVMLSAAGNAELATLAMQRGAYDYLAKPFGPADALLALRKAEERGLLRRRALLLERDVRRAVGERPIVAASQPMIDLLEGMERAAARKTPVLLTGESGTGKEVMARAIHAQSPRRSQAFVAVDCSATPESLLESELFGHPKGAFSGADRTRAGFVALADQGTLFLDEISALPLPLQPKLLHMLQREEVQPVGESKGRRVDVRVIAATTRDLDERVATGGFREDLSARLTAGTLRVPALRERLLDIPLLVDHFLARARTALRKPIHTVTDEALERLVAYSWPGNVRELENVIERAVILAGADRITPNELPENVVDPPRSAAPSETLLPLKTARKTFEAQLIRRALRATGGNRTRAARLLEISHRALLYKLKEHAIDE